MTGPDLRTASGRVPTYCPICGTISGYIPDYDKRLRMAQVYEDAFGALFSAERTTEIKTDHNAWETGRIAYELGCDGKPSGLNALGYVYHVTLIVQPETRQIAEFVGFRAWDLMALLLAHAGDWTAGFRPRIGGKVQNTVILTVPIADLLHNWKRPPTPHTDPRYSAKWKHFYSPNAYDWDAIKDGATELSDIWKGA